MIAKIRRQFLFFNNKREIALAIKFWHYYDPAYGTAIRILKRGSYKGNRLIGINFKDDLLAIGLWFVGCKIGLVSIHSTRFK